jgi:Family of unknown function (DUF5924)/Protein of unknown function (DUF2914)
MLNPVLREPISPRATRPPAPSGEVHVAPPVPFAPTLVERVRSVGRRHGRKLWWLHSVYALGLGLAVVTFAQKGLDHTRWLAASVSAAWLLVVVFFRVFGSGRQQAHLDGVEASTRTKLRFFAMTYVLKNLYQGMLFFLLPFYWKSTTFGAPNGWFVMLIAACALVSTLDIVFDRVVFRFRAFASLFHALALFACLNLIVPVLFPNTRALVSLLVAAAVTVLGFWTIHVNFATLRDRRQKLRWLAAILASLGLAVGGAYEARAAIPPVPLYVAHGAVGPMMLADGRLAMEVKDLHPSVIDKLIAITDVVIPSGALGAGARGDELFHVWRHDGVEVYRVLEEAGAQVEGEPPGTMRLRSTLEGKQLPARLTGHWSVDVETGDGQLVGRVSFTVAD